jgi:hypothetical protein
MHHGLGQQILETTVVAALGCGLVDLKQRLGFRPAHWLMIERGCGDDTHAPGSVSGIQRAGEMDAALGGGPLARDHAIANDGQCKGGGVSTGNLGGFEGSDEFGSGRKRGRHGYLLVQVLFLCQSSDSEVRKLSRRPLMRTSESEL